MFWGILMILKLNWIHFVIIEQPKKNWIKIGQEMTRLGVRSSLLCFIISCNFSCHLISKQNLNGSYAKWFSAIAFPTKMARKSNASKNQEEFGAVLWNRNLRIFALSIESIQVRRFSWIHPNAKSKSNSKKVLFLSLLVRELSEY